MEEITLGGYVSVVKQGRQGLTTVRGMTRLGVVGVLPVLGLPVYLCK